MADSAIVVGGGILGLGTALELKQRGLDVTIVEQFSPGHVRASSAGESRLLRMGHGSDIWFTEAARESRGRWLELEEMTGKSLYIQSGVVWFAEEDDSWESESIGAMTEIGIAVQKLTPDETSQLFPDIDVSTLRYSLLEPMSGVIRAKAATHVLANLLTRQGARFRSGEAVIQDGSVIVDGEALGADLVVWACGPWLTQVFPLLLPIVVTKQDVLFFGAGPEWSTPPVPAFMDYAAAAYGLGDLDGLGVKVVSDEEGTEFDPTDGERTPSEESVRRVRDYLGRRFPKLVSAPIIFSRTCQYSLTPDTEFIVAEHPELPSHWIVGGGSGHAFKHGLTIGALAARTALGRMEPLERFSLKQRNSDQNLRHSM